MPVARYWREQKHRYNLLGSKCGMCKEVFFPPRLICPECHRQSIGKIEPFTLAPSGTIETFSIVYDAPQFQKMQTPYVIAIVRLDHGPKITSQVVDASPDDVEIGKRVNVVFRRIQESGKSGTIHYGYKFVLAD